jgi:hypothetical protein
MHGMECWQEEPVVLQINPFRTLVLVVVLLVVLLLLLGAKPGQPGACL